MRTKVFRRFKQSTKLKRRIEIFASIKWLGTDTREEFRQEIKKGRCSWIRTTARPCNCYSCSGYHKYIRETKTKVDKEISQQLSF